MRLEFLDLAKSHQAQGEIVLPGSKSISNRVLLLAALARGSCLISGLLDSDDTRVMLAGLETLGVQIDRVSEDAVRIHGVAADAQQGFPTKQAEIFLGNAGTAFRPLTAALALVGGDYRLHGVPRMHERPIGDLVDALLSFGCQIAYEQNPGYPPLRISPPNLSVKEAILIDGSVSSQFLTALLLVSPLIAAKTGEVVKIQVQGELISKPYIAITLNLMARFGVRVLQENWQQFTIAADASYQSPESLEIEGDASSASYFMALGAIGQGPVRIVGVGQESIQGDIQFAEVLADMGAQITVGDNYVEVSGPDLAERPLKAFDRDFNLIPDAAMTAAVLALYADGPCTLRNIASWRVKETDRIAAMHAELSKLGALVSSGPDWLRIEPPQQWQTAAIETYDDHRMAMCFSLATFGPVGVRILDPDCVAKTFPRYFSVYQGLVS